MGNFKTATGEGAADAALPFFQDETKKKGIFITLVYPLLLLLFSFALYGQTIFFGYVLDDDLVNRSNIFVQKGIWGIPEILSNGYLVGTTGVNDSYRPFSMLMLAIENQFWGFDPAVNHFFNVFYYSICVMLFYFLLRRIFRDTNGLVPFIISLVFLVHPVHTEVVANIKGRDEIFCFIFLLLSVHFAINYSEKRNFFALAFSGFFFFLALLSKENAITFLAITPLLFYCFRNENSRQILFLILPCFIAAVIFFFIRYLIVGNHFPQIDPLYNSLAGLDFISERLPTSIFILGKYIGLLIFPRQLVWDYSIHQIPVAGWSDGYALLSLIVFTAGLGFAFLKMKTKSVLSFCILFFFITISPVANILFPIGTTMAERLLFLPSAGFCIGLVFLFEKLIRMVLRGKLPIHSGYLSGVTAIVVLAFSLRTSARIPEWKDNLSLFEAGVRDSPNSCRTHTFLANEYSVLAQGKTQPEEKKQFFQKAEAAFKRGLEIFPDNPEAWYNCGVMNLETGKPAEAEHAFRKVIFYNPEFARAHNNLGVIAAQQGNFQEAAGFFTTAAQLNSNYLDANANAAAAYFSLGEYSKAAPFFEKAYELNPGSGKLYEQMLENERRLQTAADKFPKPSK